MGLTREREQAIRDVGDLWINWEEMKELIAEIDELRDDLRDWENDCAQDEQYIIRLKAERDRYKKALEAIAEGQCWDLTSAWDTAEEALK